MYPKPPRCSSQNFRSCSSFFLSSSLASNPSGMPIESVSKNYPQSLHFSLPSLSSSFTGLSISSLSYFCSDKLFSTPKRDLLRTQIRTSHFTSQETPLVTHYRGWGRETNTYHGLWGLLASTFLTTCFYWLHNLLSLRHWTSFSCQTFCYLWSSYVLCWKAPPVPSIIEITAYITPL